MTKTHGLSGTNEHNIWLSMRNRCRNPNDPAFANYGGRGICVHPKWDDFCEFLKDVGPRPSLKHSLERIDNNKNYETGNVKWETRRVQNRNSRHNRIVNFRGNNIPLVVAAELAGIKYSIVKWRFYHGWTLEESLTIPPDSIRARPRKNKELKP